MFFFSSFHFCFNSRDEGKQTRQGCEKEMWDIEEEERQRVRFRERGEMWIYYVFSSSWKWGRIEIFHILLKEFLRSAIAPCNKVIELINIPWEKNGRFFRYFLCDSQHATRILFDVFFFYRVNVWVSESVRWRAVLFTSRQFDLEAIFLSKLFF